MQPLHPIAEAVVVLRAAEQVPVEQAPAGHRDEQCGPGDPRRHVHEAGQRGTGLAERESGRGDRGEGDGAPEGRAESEMIEHEQGE
jgi:hypothetical protein